MNKIFNENNWGTYDFDVNKYFWKNKGYESTLEIRKSNLLEMSEIFKQTKVPFWIQGRTLEGIYKNGILPDDHDDDIGIDEQYRKILESDIYVKLKKAGFSVIRNNKDMISFIRDDRYIDVCIFGTKQNKYGYATKWFPRTHFESFDSIVFADQHFLIPSKTDVLLEKMYNPSLIVKLINYLKKFLKLSNYKKLLYKFTERSLEKSPHTIRRVLSIASSPLNITYKKISKQEFLDTLIEPLDSFNWEWRKPHLDIITNSKQYCLVSEIVNYLSNKENMKKVMSEVVETDTTKEFFTPHNFDIRFWQSGNNYFIYNIKYQFRKDVLDYNKANEYIKSAKQPMLYSSTYFESCEALNDSEIEELLINKTIEIEKGSIRSGKHRACAMIGRLIAGKPYIPFWAIVKK